MTLKAHRLASVHVRAHQAVSFAVLGVGGVPKTGVAAVVVKLTASKPLATGALTVYPAGAKRPSALSVSFTVGHAGTNTVVVAPGKAGKITAYDGSAGALTLVPTVVGYYRALVSGGPAGSYFHPVTARKLSSTLVKKAGSLTFAATGLAGVPAAATTVLLQLSVLNPGGKGGLTVSPAGGTRSKSLALAFVDRTQWHSVGQGDPWGQRAGGGGQHCQGLGTGAGRRGRLPPAVQPGGRPDRGDRHQPAQRLPRLVAAPVGREPRRS